MIGCKARLTIGAIKLVTGLAENAIHQRSSSRKFCVAVTLHVKNAVNSPSWGIIWNERDTSYYPAIFDSYLPEVRDPYDLDGGPQVYVASANFPLGSVLGPPKWNNDVFDLPIAKEATVVGVIHDDICRIGCSGKASREC